MGDGIGNWDRVISGYIDVEREAERKGRSLLLDSIDTPLIAEEDRGNAVCECIRRIQRKIQIELSNS